MLGHMDPEVFALNREIQADLRTMYGTEPEAFTALLAGIRGEHPTTNPMENPRIASRVYTDARGARR